MYYTSGMTPDRYQAEAVKTRIETLTAPQQTAHLYASVAEEAGEVNRCFVRSLRGKAVSQDEVAEELGDLLWAVANLAQWVGFSLEEVMERNIAKLRARHGQTFNPAHYAKEG